MVIYELLGIITIFWGFSMIVKKDIFAPESLLCLSYIFAIICAIANINNWSINLHYNTLIIIIIGLLSFIIPSCLYFIYEQTSKKKKIVNNLEHIEIKKYKIVILDIISFFIGIIYTLYFIKAIGGISAFSNYSVAMETYRYKTAFHNENLIPAWINFLSKICRAICYICTYVIINNVINRKKNKTMKKEKNLIFLIIGICIYIPLTLMSGGRYDLIVYVLYTIMIFNILFVIKNKKRLEFKRIFKIFIIIILILTFFSSYRGLVGRNSENSGLDYITEYFGGSIEIFDIYMQKEHVTPKEFGHETFYGIHKFLSQLKLLDEDLSNKSAMTFVVVNNKVIGNVYTGFRKMYNDFGTYGVIILQVVLSIIFNKLYYGCIYKEKNKGISFRIIIVGSLCFCLALHSYSEAFFSNVLSFNYAAFFIILYVIIKFLNKEIEVK